jgi:hypothetical protein
MNGKRSAPILLLILGLLALAGPASSAAYTYRPADPPRPCDPQVARCDVELEIVNDRGIPQQAWLVLAADVADRNFFASHGPAPLQVYRRPGMLAFNFNTGRFWRESCQGMSCADLGPYRFPLPPGVSVPSARFHADHFPLSAGTTVYISRNSYSEGKMNGRDLFPEKLGIRWTVPSAGYRGQIVVPSFGTPRKPQLSPRERGTLGLLNDLRAKQGSRPLSAQPDLNAAADNFSCWLSDYLRGPEAPARITPEIHRAFGTPSMRAIDAGWPFGGVGETISFNPFSPEHGYQELLSSPGHRAVLLNPQSRWVGVAYNCQNLVITPAGPSPANREPDPSLIPFGGWGDDYGDSSLARFDDGNYDYDADLNWGQSRKFRPRIKIHRGNKRVTVTIPRRARGRLIIRSGQRRRSTDKWRLTTRINRRARLVVIFRATKSSKINSGKIKRCLKKSSRGKLRVVRCRR